MADLAKIVDDLSKLTVLEAAELAKLLEKWGVSAAAPWPLLPLAGRGRCGCRCRGADRVHRHPQVRRRQEDQRHQGSPRHHRPRPQGSQGPGRGRRQDRQGRRQQGRGRQAQEAARGPGRRRRGQVTCTGVHAARSLAALPQPPPEPSQQAVGRRALRSSSLDATASGPRGLEPGRGNDRHDRFAARTTRSGNG